MIPPFIINRNGKLQKKLVVPTFEIYSNPTIKISDIQKRRFNLIDRAVQTARNQLMSQEDTEIFAKLDAIVDKDT